MNEEKSDYLSYLLRLWRESEEKTAWRASIESSRTGERKGFASLDDLFDFLRGQIGAASDAMETETRAERGDDDMVTK